MKQIDVQIEIERGKEEKIKKIPGIKQENKKEDSTQDEYAD